MSTAWVTILLTMQFANPAGGTTTPIVEPANQPTVEQQLVEQPTVKPIATEEPSMADAPPLRAGPALRTAVRVAMRRWTRPKPDEYRTAAQDYLRIYQELQADRKLPTIDRRNYATVIRSRLIRLTMQMNRELAKQGKLPVQPATIRGPEGRDAVLGQAFGGGAGVNVQQGFGGGGGQPQGSDDYGPDFVDLIQRTIQPAAWDVNGGPGHIHYWRAQRALIIAAPQDVHDQVGDVLQQLHRLGH